jgi:hypothetical protein
VSLGNTSTHAPDIWPWLRWHKRFLLHVARTSASWMIEVETWFSEILAKSVRKTQATSARDGSRPLSAERARRDAGVSAMPVELAACDREVT